MCSAYFLCRGLDRASLGGLMVTTAVLLLSGQEGSKLATTEQQRWSDELVEYSARSHDQAPGTRLTRGELGGNDHSLNCAISSTQLPAQLEKFSPGTYREHFTLRCHCPEIRPASVLIVALFQIKHLINYISALLDSVQISYHIMRKSQWETFKWLW